MAPVSPVRNKVTSVSDGVGVGEAAVVWLATTRNRVCQRILPHVTDAAYCVAKLLVVLRRVVATDD